VPRWPASLDGDAVIALVVGNGGHGNSEFRVQGANTISIHSSTLRPADRGLRILHKTPFSRDQIRHGC